MAAWFNSLPYFSLDELACPQSNQVRLDVRFAAALPALRLAWGEPLIANSVCRNSEHNLRVGGHTRSLHLMRNYAHPVDGTMAADIAWTEWPDLRRLALARIARRLGWSVGLHPTFVHLDRRNDFGLRLAIFTYDGWSGFRPDLVSQ